MKKFKLLIALIAILGVGSVSAQKMSFGLSAGSTTAKYSIEGVSDISNTSGFNVGASWGFKLAIVSVGPELIYSRTKFSINDNSVYGQNADVVVNSIDIPIIASLNILGPVQLLAGPNFSVYNKAVATLVDGEEQKIGRITPNVGYTVGAQVVILSRLVVGVRFNGEFDNHATSMGDLSTSTYSVKNHDFSIHLGAKF
ncbi:MAG: outer membrane beta-barrel protein [Rikenellaceae bacterium]